MHKAHPLFIPHQPQPIPMTGEAVAPNSGL